MKVELDNAQNTPHLDILDERGKIVTQISFCSDDILINGKPLSKFPKEDAIKIYGEGDKEHEPGMSEPKSGINKIIAFCGDEPDVCTGEILMYLDKMGWGVPDNKTQIAEAITAVKIISRHNTNHECEDCGKSYCGENAALVRLDQGGQLIVCKDCADKYTK